MGRGKREVLREFWELMQSNCWEKREIECNWRGINDGREEKSFSLHTLNLTYDHKVMNRRIKEAAPNQNKNISPYTNVNTSKGTKSALLRTSPYNSKISEIKPIASQSKRGNYSREAGLIVNKNTRESSSEDCAPFLIKTQEMKLQEHWNTPQFVTNTVNEFPNFMKSKKSEQGQPKYKTPITGNSGAKKSTINHQLFEGDFDSKNFSILKLPDNFGADSYAEKKGPKKLPPLHKKPLGEIMKVKAHHIIHKKLNRRKRLHEPEVKIQVMEPIKIEVIGNAQNLNENPQDSNFNLNPRQTLLSFSQDGELIISKDNSYFDESQKYYDKRRNSNINSILSRLKDEVKPMFIFNCKYRKSDSINSKTNTDLLTPSFGIMCRSECNGTSRKSHSSCASFANFKEKVLKDNQIKFKLNHQNRNKEQK